MLCQISSEAAAGWANVAIVALGMIGAVMLYVVRKEIGGMREDVREVKGDVKDLLGKQAEHETRITVVEHDLADRPKKRVAV